MKYILTLLYMIFSSGGIILIKLGGDSLKLTLKNGFDLKMGYVTLTGFVCYIISFLLWQKVLVSYNVSYIVPITTGVMQIIILILSILFLKEPFNLQSILGTIIIIIGVIVLTTGTPK